MKITTPEQKERRDFYRLLIPLMVAELVAALELTMIYAAMPNLAADLGGTSQAGWLLTSFMLSAAAGAALFGRIGDLLGRRNVLLWVLFLSTAGSVISSVTKELEWLVLGRAMQGLAGAIIPLCFGMIRERVQPSRVPLGIGLISSSATIASACGLVIGGLIIDYSDWTMIFKFSAGLGVFAMLTVIFFVTKDKQTSGSGQLEDVLGGMLFVPAVVSLLLGITHSAKHGLLDNTSLLWFAGAAAFSMAWVWRELSVKNPLIDVRLLSKPEIAWPNILMVFVALGVFQGGHLMAMFGQQPMSTGVGLGLTATFAGLLLLPANILGGMSTPFIATAVNRYGPRNIARLGCLLMGGSFLILAFFNDNVFFVVLLLVFQGVGLIILFVTTPIIVVHSCPSDRTSEATGMMAVIRSTAMAIGAQTVAALLSVGGGVQAVAGGPVFPSETAYVTVFLYVAGTALIGLLICQKLPKTLTMPMAVEQPK